MKRINCWEYQRCGREPNGRNTKLLGVCPAAADRTFDGINSGKCAGRFCWAVAGTLCEGKHQGTYAEKQSSCHDCDFFKSVLAEEGTMNLRTKLLRFLPPYTRHALLNDLELKKVKKSTRFIVQGDTSGEAYIIKRGSCLLVVEKDEVLHPIDHRGEGDILNMSALFTGEPVSSHTEAETDMELWVLKRKLFEKIPDNDPDMFNFLTEIVAARFDSKRPISDRSIATYVATDIIGRGGYSIVYKGFDSKNGQPIAIKMMRYNMAMDHDFLEKFRNEARIVAGLSHENIIKVYDIKERFRTAFIIMEYLDAESIAEKLKKKRNIDPKTACNYLIQICQAIYYAHKMGVLHKDINPENLMVTKNHVVKLLDFGLAGFIQDEDDLVDGSFSYLAPEIFNGELSSIQSEIYSLGTTAFEMVVGQRPYPESDQAVFAKMRCEKQIPDPGELVVDLPDSLRHFIIKACRLNPVERYKNMGEALKDLDLAKKTLSQSPQHKINCWEFMKCGRGPDESKPGYSIPGESNPGGSNPGESKPGKSKPGESNNKCDTCPATLPSSLDGFNEGTMAGRACWLIAGTFCSNNVSGAFAEKIESCRYCDFYKAVNKGSGQTRLKIDNIDIFGLTHIGLHKKTNEDRYLVRQMEDKSLMLAVADGLGGDVSSDFAAEIVKGTLVGLQKLSVGNEIPRLIQMVLDLDTTISLKSETHPDLEGMATTLVCGILKKDHFHWINVGDSRLYLLRDEKLIQLSEDQTLAKFLIEEGELLPENASKHYSYDIVDQCIGYGVGDCAPQTGSFKVQKNDLLILLTDGLHKMVPQKKILSVLNGDASIEAKTKQLNQAALDFGGKDNITIVMAKINQTLK